MLCMSSNVNTVLRIDDMMWHIVVFRVLSLFMN